MTPIERIRRAHHERHNNVRIAAFLGDNEWLERLAKEKVADVLGQEGSTPDTDKLGVDTQGHEA